MRRKEGRERKRRKVGRSLAGQTLESLHRETKVRGSLARETRGEGREFGQ